MKKKSRLVITCIMCLIFCLSIVVPVLATPNTLPTELVQNQYDSSVCSKCGKSFTGDGVKQSQIAKALGMDLCTECWLQKEYGNDQTTITKVAQLDEMGKVPATQLGGSDPKGDYFLRSDRTWVAVSGGSAVWGDITGTLALQLDLKSALDAKISEITGTHLDSVFSQNGLLKRTGTGTYTVDTNSYLTGNQSITLSGDASGSGTTSISVTNSGLKGVALPALSTGYLYYSGSAWAFQTPAGGSNPSWYGKLYATRGDCDPVVQALHENMLAVAAPTPTNITVSIARCVQFTPPANITVASIRLFGVGATTNLYKFAIYAVGTSTAKLWDSGTVTTTANAWLNLTSGLPITLTAGTKYWWCVTVVSTGTTAGFRSEAAPLGTNYWGDNVAPLGGTSLGLPVYAQFAVSTGVFPSTLPTIAAAAYAGGTTGSVPFALLDFGGQK